MYTNKRMQESPILLNLPGPKRSGRESVRDLCRGSSAACCPEQGTCTSDIRLKRPAPDLQLMQDPHRTNASPGSALALMRELSTSRQDPHRTSSSPRRIWSCARTYAGAGRSCLRLPGPKLHLYGRPPLYQYITMPHLDLRAHVRARWPELSTSTWT